MISNPGGDLADQFEMKGCLPKPWQYIPWYKSEVQQGTSGRAFVHPHLWFMVFCGYEGHIDDVPLS
jgi:hypothetical protein